MGKAKAVAASSDKQPVASAGDASSAENASAKEQTATTKPKVQDIALQRAKIGKPASGRVWKLRHNKVQRASLRALPPTLKTTWEEKQQKRQEQKERKERELRLLQELEEKKKAERQRAIQKKKQKLENERKSSQVQVIRNTAKLKRMSKKQLRNIEMR
ncbi:Coiled-coil domain containing 86 [Balamuthia mandrillaris]